MLDQVIKYKVQWVMGLGEKQKEDQGVTFQTNIDVERGKNLNIGELPFSSALQGVSVKSRDVDKLHLFFPQEGP